MIIRLVRIAPIVVVACVAAIIPMYAQRDAGVAVVHSDQRELLLDVTPSAVVDTLAGGALLPIVPMAQITTGAPADPVRMVITLPIAIPSTAGNSLDVVSIEYAPAVPGRLASLAEALGRPAMSLPAVVAPIDGPLLPAVAELRYGGIARNVHVGEIRIAPFRYDPRSRSLEILRSIRVRVRYAMPPSGRGARPALASAFINGAAAGGWGIESRGSAALLRPTVVTPRAWMRVDVAGEGLYALTATDFQRAGIDLSSARDLVIYGGNGADLPERVTLADSNRLAPLPAIVEKGSDGRISRLLFYGVGASSWRYRQASDTIPLHAISPYVRANSYLVAVDGDPGRAFQSIGSPGTPTIFPTTGITRLFVEEDRVNAIDYNGNGNGSGRIWFGPQFEVIEGGQTDTRQFETALPGLDRNGPIIYRVRAAHTGRGGAAVGSMGVAEGDRSLGGRISLGYVSDDEEGGWTANAADAVYSLPSADAIGGDNRSRLRLDYRSGLPARGFLDWYEIHYTRRLEAVDNRISFEAPRGEGIAEFRIGGFGSDDIIALDVTDPANPIRLDRVAGAPGEFIFHARLSLDRRQARRYFLTTISSAQSVLGTAGATFGDLRGRRLDPEVMVITAAELRESAEKYAEYRRSQGMSASVVTVEEIYTEYGHGNADPTAIRDYLAQTAHLPNGRLRFVVMFGRASYDYRKLIAGTRPMVPTMESPDITGGYNDIYSSAYDDYFVRVDGDDGRVDLVTGRIPVESNQEGEEQVAKIRTYESDRYFGTWRQTIILSADDNTPQKGAGGFVTQSEEIWAREVPEWIDTRKIYLPAYPTEITVGRRKPEATRDLDQFIRRGALLTNWLGHGNPKVWAHENLLERDKLIPYLDNDTALTFVMAATCNFGSFDSRDRSGADLFVLNPKGGAIGVLASSRTSYTGPNSRMNLLYMRQILNRNPATGHYPTIGEALLNVKQASDISTLDNDEKYHILGDPVLKLNIPQDEVVVTAINGISTADSTVVVGALSVVTVEGEIQRGSGLRSDFNGYAVISLYEADRAVVYREQLDTRVDEHHVLEPGGRLFQGPARVESGRFRGTFRIPKEISFNRDEGRLLVYAYNEREDAAGATRRVRVYGSDTAAITDVKGPDIRIFLDDRSFRAGDLVTPSPLLIIELADTSGINASNAGIGHGIEAWVDGNPTSVDLTDRYQTLPTSYQIGSTERRLDTLSPGRHELRVRAWDIFNNPSETTTFFRIAEHGSESLEVVDVVNIPNPMSRRTVFTFRHNQREPLDVDIAIYTLSGRKVRDLPARGVVDRLAQVEWDGTDSDGNLLANGVYLYRLKVTSGEMVFETIEKVVVLR